MSDQLPTTSQFNHMLRVVSNSYQHMENQYQSFEHKQADMINTIQTMQTEIADVKDKIFSLRSQLLTNQHQFTATMNNIINLSRVATSSKQTNDLIVSKLDDLENVIVTTNSKFVSLNTNAAQLVELQNKQLTEIQKLGQNASSSSQPPQHLYPSYVNEKHYQHSGVTNAHQNSRGPTTNQTKFNPSLLNNHNNMSDLDTSSIPLAPVDLPPRGKENMNSNTGSYPTRYATGSRRSMSASMFSQAPNHSTSIDPAQPCWNTTSNPMNNQNDLFSLLNEFK